MGGTCSGDDRQQLDRHKHHFGFCGGSARTNMFQEDRMMGPLVHEKVNDSWCKKKNKIKHEELQERLAKRAAVKKRQEELAAAQAEQSDTSEDDHSDADDHPERPKDRTPLFHTIKNLKAAHAFGVKEVEKHMGTDWASLLGNLSKEERKEKQVNKAAGLFKKGLMKKKEDSQGAPSASGDVHTRFKSKVSVVKIEKEGSDSDSSKSSSLHWGHDDHAWCHNEHEKEVDFHDHAVSECGTKILLKSCDVRAHMEEHDEHHEEHLHTPPSDPEHFCHKEHEKDIDFHDHAVSECGTKILLKSCDVRTHMEEHDEHHEERPHTPPSDHEHFCHKEHEKDLDFHSSDDDKAKDPSAWCHREHHNEIDFHDDDHHSGPKIFLDHEPSSSSGYGQEQAIKATSSGDEPESKEKKKKEKKKKDAKTDALSKISAMQALTENADDQDVSKSKKSKKKSKDESDVDQDDVGLEAHIQEQALKLQGVTSVVHHEDEDLDEVYVALQPGKSKGMSTWASGYIGWWAEEEDLQMGLEPRGKIKLIKVSKIQQDLNFTSRLCKSGSAVRVSYKEEDDAQDQVFIRASEEEAAQWAKGLKDLVKQARELRKK